VGAQQYASEKDSRRTLESLYRSLRGTSGIRVDDGGLVAVESSEVEVDGDAEAQAAAKAVSPAVLRLEAVGQTRLSGASPPWSIVRPGVEHVEVGAWTVATEQSPALGIALPSRYFRCLGLPRLVDSEEDGGSLAGWSDAA
jgi:hypothetical protein